jgi:hypothetical protein
MDTQTDAFIKDFLEKYRKMILLKARSKNLNDIQDSFRKITLGKLRSSSILAANEVLLSKKNTTRNGSTFLGAVVNNLAGILLGKIIECSINTKQKKLYPSCVILAIANDDNLATLSNTLGHIIPRKPSSTDVLEDSRTNKQLRKLLHEQDLKGVKHFSKEQLLFLLAPSADGSYTEEEEEEEEVGVTSSTPTPSSYTNNLIKFYTNLYPANNKKNYFFSDIVGKWDDYNLEVKHDFIQWLFPDSTGGVNHKAPKLNKKDILEFQKNPILRSNVAEATLRMLLFYGFTLKGHGVEQVKPLNRRDRGRTIGLFSIHNYNRITRIMDFLVDIKMEYLAAIFFLAMCQAIKTNNLILKKVVRNKSLKKWMSTQPFLLKHVHTYNTSKLTGKKLPSPSPSSDTGEWVIDYPSSGSELDRRIDFGSSDDEGDSEWDSIPSGLLYDSHSPVKPKKSKKSKKKKEKSELEIACKYKVKGLNYVSNSCYMDSTLLSLFAVPNKVITDNILKKNLDDLETFQKRWSKCSNNIKTDIKRRKNIQTALNQITESIRGLNTVKECTMLRRLIAKCPGTQPFHRGGTQDAGEFLAYLFNLFQIDIAKTVRKTYGTNQTGDDPDWKLIRKQVDKKASPIIDIVSTTLRDIPKDYDITKFVKKTEYTVLGETERWFPDKVNKPGLSYLRKKETFKMKRSPYVIFNLTRTYGEARFSKPNNPEKPKFLGMRTKNIWKRISAPEKLTIKGKDLYLTAIVVHTGGVHYVANFKCDNDWFWYDDRPDSSRHIIKHIGSYEKMIKTNLKPLSHGTLFFYT